MSKSGAEDRVDVRGGSMTVHRRFRSSSPTMWKPSSTSSTWARSCSSVTRWAARSPRSWPAGHAEDVSAYAHQITAPTLVIAGEHDQVEPAHVLVENLLPHIPGATMVTIPDVGHLLPLESPGELAAAILPHLGPAR